MRAYFVRHGESEANILEVISNRGSVHGLTEKGRRQANQLANYLSGEGIAHIFCSPLLRAVQTAEILSRAYSLPITIADGLREFDCGEIEGRSDPEGWATFRALVRRWMKDQEFDSRISGGESFNDIRTRFFSMIESQLNPLIDKEGDALLVGHGMVLYLMLPLLFSNINDAFARQYSISNTGYALGVGSAEGWHCQEWFGAALPED